MFAPDRGRLDLGPRRIGAVDLDDVRRVLDRLGVGGIRPVPVAGRRAVGRPDDDHDLGLRRALSGSNGRDGGREQAGDDAGDGEQEGKDGTGTSAMDGSAMGGVDPMCLILAGEALRPQSRDGPAVASPFGRHALRSRPEGWGSGSCDDAPGGARRLQTPHQRPSRGRSPYNRSPGSPSPRSRSASAVSDGLDRSRSDRIERRRRGPATGRRRRGSSQANPSSSAPSYSFVTK